MKKWFCLLLMMVLGSELYAQALKENLSQYTRANARAYLEPLLNTLTSDYNSGLYHNARIKRKGFSFYFGVVGQVAVIPSSSKYFYALTEGGVQPAGPYRVPGVFGADEGPEVELDSGSGTQSYSFPGGFDLNYMPLAMPQLSIGSLWGTDLSLRYFALDVEDFGKSHVFGWGVRHSISQYFKSLPLDMALGYYRQKFEVDNYIDTSSDIINLQTSFSIPVITFYGGVGYEKSTMDVSYIYYGPVINGEQSGEGESVQFAMEGDNQWRFTAGVTFNFGPIKVHGDYNLAAEQTFAVGLGIGIND